MATWYAQLRRRWYDRQLWPRPARYCLYFLGIRYGNPRSKPGTRSWPLNYSEWKLWYRRGF